MSLGFAQQIDVDIIMLSDETAVIKNWNKILNWLKITLKKITTNPNLAKKRLKKIIFLEIGKRLPNIPAVVFKRICSNNIVK